MMKSPSVTALAEAVYPDNATLASQTTCTAASAYLIPAASKNVEKFTVAAVQTFATTKKWTPAYGSMTAYSSKKADGTAQTETMYEQYYIVMKASSASALATGAAAGLVAAAIA